MGFFSSLFTKNRKSIETHAFFTSLQREIQIKVDQIQLSCKIKQRLVRTFLKIVLQIYHDTILQYIRDGKSFSDGISLETMMNSCYVRYHEQAKIEGIPTIFLDRFDQFFRGNFEIATDTIKSIGESNFYKNDHTKMVAVLDTLNFAFIMLMINVEKTIETMNGDLEKALRGTKFDVG